MIASDNTRDPFYPFGDLDMMEIWREGVRILHLDYPFADWAAAVSALPLRRWGSTSAFCARAARRHDPDAMRAISRSSWPVRNPIASLSEAAKRRTPAPPDYSELDAS